METKVIVMLIGLACLCTASPSTPQEYDKGLSEQQSISKPLDERSSISRFAQKCPPGLWCGKKRGLNKRTKDRLSMTKFAGHDCPPGIWCGKKRQVNLKAFETPQHQAQNVQTVNPQAEEINPNKANKVFPENLKQGPIDEKLFRRIEDDCPPGLWCGKKRSAPSKLADRSSTNCPPGLWCGK
ncbi:uncharacterized protein LOC116291611 [Actinia tenebrosa]|uniref:Uncharacterized protein LOC116291611 n=1 Tax=Actinia tenebrosa TaxID=6105 RepID=A0A6P8HFR5_ACTTE|nr:uncharacterized protein LOC116291611 [Actinia tenebrosa]